MLTRAVPLVVIATAAFFGGIVLASGPDAPAAERFLDAWERDDYAPMHAEITTEAQSKFPLEAFERTYADAAETATITALDAGEVSEGDDAAVATVSFDTHAFGDLNGELSLPMYDDLVAWAPNLVYPGLAVERAPRAPYPGAGASGDPGRRPHPAGARVRPPRAPSTRPPLPWSARSAPRRATRPQSWPLAVSRRER